MREIKFRAWDVLHKTMHTDNPQVFIRLDGGIHWMAHSGMEKLVGQLKLMQYTGLKDKNGKEIYEGDIVRIKHRFKDRTWTGEIIYEGNKFMGNGFYFTHFDDPSDLLGEGLEHLEVIGNIYENPELLERSDPNPREEHIRHEYR